MFSQFVVSPRSHWLVNSFVSFGAPYMATDICAMYLSHYHTQRVRGHACSSHSLETVKSFLVTDWMLVLHHLVLLLVFLPITLVSSSRTCLVRTTSRHIADDAAGQFFRRGLGDFFIGCLLTTELSTPFISAGKILIQVDDNTSELVRFLYSEHSFRCADEQLGLDHTRLHRINGVIVLLSFLTCRILIFPFMYWTYGRQFGIPLHRVVFHLPLHCNAGNLLILLPQIYWFHLLLKKARRLYRRQVRGTD